MSVEPGPRDRSPDDYKLPPGQEGLDSVKESINQQVAESPEDSSPDVVLIQRVLKAAFDRTARDYLESRWAKALIRFNRLSSLYQWFHLVIRVGIFIVLALTVVLAFVRETESFSNRLYLMLLGLTGLFLYSCEEVFRVDQRRLLYRTAVEHLRNEGWRYVSRMGRYAQEGGRLRTSLFVHRAELILNSAERLAFENLSLLNNLEWTDESQVGPKRLGQSPPD